MKKYTLFILVFLVCVLAHAEKSKGESQNAWYTQKFPKSLVNAAGKKVDTSSALKGKMVGLYFSASWCGPCRGFTPELIKFYNQVARKSRLEIVLISHDRTEQDMSNYMKNDKMPWLAVPFSDQERGALKQEFGVSGIPTFIVLDSKGKVVSKNARWDVVKLGPKAVSAWHSKNYKPLTYQDMQNSSKNKKN